MVELRPNKCEFVSFDLRIQACLRFVAEKHVFFATRDNIDRQRKKKKSVWRVSEHVFFYSKQRALLCHCERCPICLVDTRTLVQTKFGTAASVPRRPSALKTHHNQKRTRSNSVRLQDGTTWRTLHMSCHGLRA